VRKYDDVARTLLWLFPVCCLSAQTHHLSAEQFVPGASLSDIIEKVRDYNSHSEFFAGILRSAALCSKEGDNVFVFRYWATPYMDSISETRSVHRRVSDTEYVVTSTTLAFGSPKDLPDRNHICQGTLPGVFYIKHMEATWRYEQTPAGVQIKAEADAELSGFALLRATAKRVLGQIMTRSLEQYKQRFRR
jgi:hypothetical protein